MQLVYVAVKSLVVVNDFQGDAGFLVFAEQVALGVETAEDLAEGQVVATAGTAQTG